MITNLLSDLLYMLIWLFIISPIFVLFLIFSSLTGKKGNKIIVALSIIYLIFWGICITIAIVIPNPPREPVEELGIEDLRTQAQDALSKGDYKLACKYYREAWEISYRNKLRITTRSILREMTFISSPEFYEFWVDLFNLYLENEDDPLLDAKLIIRGMLNSDKEKAKVFLKENMKKVKSGCIKGELLFLEKQNWEI
ncbi:hypothetical protein J7M23_07415 [Candidatus Sumerlaeota bacterium]|nr:hypothetical protein [Candidatus Sumerlaeota bacterium]